MQYQVYCNIRESADFFTYSETYLYGYEEQW